MSDLNVGLSLQNVGTSVKLNEEAFELPQNMTLGLNYVLSDRGNIGVDCTSNLQENNLNIKLGGEYILKDILALRAGCMFNRAENTGPGLTLGAGFLFEELSLDYGFLPFGEFGFTHKISLNIKFGQSNIKLAKRHQNKTYYRALNKKTKSSKIALKSLD